MNNHVYVRSFGGRFNVKELKDVARTALKNNIEYCIVGTRQDLIFTDNHESLPKFHRKLEELQSLILGGAKNPISSMPVVNVMPTKKWMHSGIYTKILKNISDSNLTISLIDPEQDLIPLCDSQLNFVASSEYDYWYLVSCLEGKKSKPYIWSVLIGSESIPKIVEAVSEYRKKNPNSSSKEIADYINSHIDYDNTTYSKKLTIPHQKPFFNDGFFTFDKKKSYLTFSAKGERMKMTALEHLAILCEQQNIDYVYLTPWQHFLIGAIENKDVEDWEHYLSLYKIFTGNAYYELNWKTDPLNSEHQEVKKSIIRMLQKEKIRTNGLSFGMMCENLEIFPSILIDSKRVFKFLPWKTYSLYCAKDFNSNQRQYELKKSEMGWKELKANILSLAVSYQKTMRQFSIEEEEEKTKTYKNQDTDPVYECGVCFTHYVTSLGDNVQDIPANTPFSELDETYECPTCGAEKSAYKEWIESEMVY